MSFKIKHLIYPIGKECKIIFEPCFPVKIDKNTEYKVIVKPFSGLKKYGLKNCTIKPTEQDEIFFEQAHTLTVRDGFLEFKATFPQEDRYLWKILIDDTCVANFETYALDEDLFNLNPYKGDNHLHTNFSDGSESPMYMAAACCKFGYDYCVITDHYQYEPSLLAIDFYKDTNVDFLIIPGEEVHSPDNFVHIINLGGTKSINDWWRNNEAEYRFLVDEEIKQITEPMTARNKYAAAACQVIFDKIREADGVSVHCHPHWIVENGFNESEEVTDYLFDHKRFDVFELIAGGAYEEGTQLQLSYYHDRETMPIVGSSDSHNCFGNSLEPGNYTIVFAKAFDKESIKNAIRNGKTVAGNQNKLYGDFRLLKYAYFLQKNYYPSHRNKRASLGGNMIRMACSTEEQRVHFASILDRIRPTEDFLNLRYSE